MTNSFSFLYQLKHDQNFSCEICFLLQKFREEAQKIKTEAENLGSLLRTKEVELYACQKEVEVLKLEIGHLNSKITEVIVGFSFKILESFTDCVFTFCFWQLQSSTKIVDIEEYEQMKNELESTKVN